LKEREQDCGKGIDNDFEHTEEMHMAATLIKNGRIVTAVDDYAADILVVDGKIQTIGRNLAVGADVEVHDAKGLVVMPAASTCIRTSTGNLAQSTPSIHSAPGPSPQHSAARRR
jgi:urease alpha subunit